MFRERVWQDNAKFCSQAGQNGFSGRRRGKVKNKKTIFTGDKITFPLCNNSLTGTKSCSDFD